MHGGQKIGIAAFQAENANPAGIVVQWNGVKAAHAGFSKILPELGARFFAIGANLLVVLAYVDDFLR